MLRHQLRAIRSRPLKATVSPTLPRLLTPYAPRPFHAPQSIRSRSIHAKPSPTFVNFQRPQIQSTPRPQPRLCASNSPPPPPRPPTSATVLIYSLRWSQIEITQKGLQKIGDILHGIPFHGVTTVWIRQVAKALEESGDDFRGCAPSPPVPSPSEVRGNRGPRHRLQSYYSRSTATPEELAETTTQRRIDRLQERILANPDWGHVYFEAVLTEDGVRAMGGDEEIRRVVEVLLRNGWVEPLEDVESFYEMIVRESWAL
ncbi:hypothetical protein ABW19_dt0209973 [Dactylella cylindrospora]|nr:hypothetical protein ABW19_dt0209973 [Dactylella cylindrospora]